MILSERMSVDGEDEIESEDEIKILMKFLMNS